ncbi:MAG: tRNA pseudouridine(38-40) synthase TruA [Planctomycetes bacterium]|nr:tRNA pseudouridine(38-40) synthase TruA [Planctomycetota bacterium]
MPTYRLTIAYDGTNFSGWQTQPTQRTVQSVVEQAWQEITGEQMRVTAASRTDAGVHALGQVVGVKTASPMAAPKLLGGLNAKLPDDVVVMAVEKAPSDFHATHDSLGKHYRYQIHNDRRRPLLDRQYVWHLPQPLDVAAMHRAGQTLVGKHDFASFQSAGSPRESTVRTIFAIEVGRGEGRGASRVEIEVYGDGFLYNMVRAIAGTLVAVGVGRKPESWPAEVLAAIDRRAAGQTAPPQGLLLLRVEYPEYKHEAQASGF